MPVRQVHCHVPNVSQSSLADDKEGAYNEEGEGEDKKEQDEKIRHFQGTLRMLLVEPTSSNTRRNMEYLNRQVDALAIDMLRGDPDTHKKKRCRQQ